MIACTKSQINWSVKIDKGIFLTTYFMIVVDTLILGLDRG